MAEQDQENLKARQRKQRLRRAHEAKRRGYLTDELNLTEGEFDELYGPDAALGDQYVMQRAEHPESPWDLTEEDLKDRAFIKEDETRDF